jgi:adenylyltransferase/sulfurtransferase
MGERSRRLIDFDNELCHHQIIIPEVGEAGQLVLLRSRVLIISVGGLGSPALYYLTACGIGEIGIVDSDRVEFYNLQRQIVYDQQEVGKES